jgi:hypothetical protein
MLLAVLFVSLLCNSALAQQYIMPVINGGVGGVMNTIIEVMAKEYPNAHIVEQSQNVIAFQETQGTILGEADAFYNFYVFPAIAEDRTVYTNVKMVVRFLQEEIDRDYFHDILISIKALNDGYYHYGFEFEKNKITKIHHDSNSYEVGLREGDKIVSINGYKIVNNTMLKRIMACPHVTFVTKDGKTVTAEGFYISPEQYRQYYFR